MDAGVTEVNKTNHRPYVNALHIRTVTHACKTLLTLLGQGPRTTQLEESVLI